VIEVRAPSRIAFLLLFLVILALPACDQTINYPQPTLTSLNPTNINANSPQFILKVMGKNFVQQTSVNWSTSTGSVTLPVVFFISTNEIDAQIPPSLIENPGTANISVTTPTPGGGTSPSSTQPLIVFTINPIQSPTPSISSVTPTALTAASGTSSTITIFGKNFVSESTVVVNSANRTTTYVNPSQLQATLAAGDVAQPGSLNISVLNPEPGGGASNTVSLAVNLAVPTISKVDPISAVAGATATTVTVTGAGFVAGYTTIEMNGVPEPTNVSNATTATTTLMPAQLLQGGVQNIEIVNSAPGGGTSNSLPFSVNPKPLLGLPVILDLAVDAQQATNGICGGLADCGDGALGLTIPTVGPSTSSTGSWVAFASASHNLILTDQNPNSDIYLRSDCLQTATSTTDCTPLTTLVSSDPNGNAANGTSSEPSIATSATAPGFAAFTSTATNLTTSVPIPAGNSQVYWRPLCTATLTACQVTSTTFVTELVSVGADGLSAGNGASYNPVVSADGQYVAFVSLATNLVSSVNADGVTPQVYVRSTCNGATPTSTCAATTYLVSTADGVTPGNRPSSNPSISADGLFVSFTSSASNLGATAPNPASTAQVFERSTCITTLGATTNTCSPLTFLVSTPDGTTPGNGASGQSAISFTTSSTSTSGVPYNGRFVAFASTATNLVPGSGPTQQIYMRDTCTGVTTSSIITNCTPTTILVSTADGVTPGNGLSEHPSISGAAEFVAFASQSSNFANTTNGVENIFVRNTCVAVDISCTQGLAIASIPQGTNPSPANGSSYVPSISANGQTVAFLSFASNLVPNDTNGLEDMFLGTTSFTTVVVTGDKQTPAGEPEVETADTDPASVLNGPAHEKSR
jgi:WD40-like Beta Propeller Repeat